MLRPYFTTTAPPVVFCLALFKADRHAEPERFAGSDGRYSRVPIEIVPLLTNLNGRAHACHGLARRLKGIDRGEGAGGQHASEERTDAGLLTPMCMGSRVSCPA